jgi:acetyltransferase-like isoleucine patch superfamily enzyme
MARNENAIRQLSAAEIDAVTGGGVLLSDGVLLGDGVMLRDGVLLSDGVRRDGVLVGD